MAKESPHSITRKRLAGSGDHRSLLLGHTTDRHLPGAPRMTSGGTTSRPSAPRSAPARTSPVNLSAMATTFRRDAKDISARLNRSPTARRLAGYAGDGLGLLPGVARGAWDTGKGAVDGAIFVTRLLDPDDASEHPQGQAAWDEVVSAGTGAINGAKHAISNPKAASKELVEQLHKFRAGIDPSVDAPAKTIADEFNRNFKIGMNQGEVAFDLGSMAIGAPELKGLGALGKYSEAAEEARFLAKGYSPRFAKYLSQPYDGIGHHALAQRTKLPAFLGGGPAPRAIVDHPMLRLKPPNMSKGQFFEHHYRVDPKYHGGKISGGGGWSGAKLGWKKYGPIGRTWHGTPGQIKATVGAGGLLGAVSATHQVDHRRTQHAG
jgi:hypothetical protein